MSRMMWDMSNMIARGFRSGIHSGHGQVSMISTGKEWLKSGKKKNQPDNKKKITDSMSTFKNLKVEEQTSVTEAEENIQEMQTPKTEVVAAVTPAVNIHKEDRSARLREAVLWSEILGEPTAKKRQRKRMEQRYGNQSYAGRR